MNAAYPDMSGLPDGIVAKIDPTGTTLLYSTYIGGTGSTNLTGIAVASTGAAWVAGTSGAGFPSTAGAYQSTTGNGVVFKLDTNGTLLYSTYFSGGGSAIAVDPAGNAYVTGQATTGFAATAGAFQTAPQGLGDGYVAKFSPAGALIYATYMGGAGTDLLIAIAVDSGGNAYTTGYTTSPSFPGAPGGGAQTVNKGGCDGFVAKLNPSGTALSYFTFLGGSTYDAGRAIAVDSQGNAYVAGGTNSTDFPVTQGALQGTFGGGLSDSFVAKLNAAGSMFTYVTYLGGSRLESMRGIAIDGAGDAYVTGYSQSLNFPTLNPIQATQPDTQNVTALFQTTNSGSSWTPFDENISGIVSNVLPDPGTEGVIVALADSGVFRTTNGGTTWSQTFAAAANAESNYGNGSLSRSLADGNTIYFLYYTEILDGAASNSTIVYRSTDGGATWGLAGTVLPTTAIYPGIIAADPLNAGTAYIAGTASTVYQTTNGGATWTTLSTGLPDTNVVTLVPSPDGSIYMGTAAAAVYKSTNQGSTWTSVSSGLSGNGIANGLAVSPSNPAVLYWSNGSTTIYTTSNGGTSWAAVAGQLPSNVTSIVVAAFNASRVYVTLGSSSVVYVSTNGGSTWGGGNGNVGLATPNLVVVDPLRGGTLYAIAAIFPEATFVSEVNPGGSALVYSTYLSGSLLGTGNAIAAYGGDAIVAGAIAGLFPIATAWQTNSHTNTAFVARITGGAAPCTYTVSPLSQTIYSLAQSLVFDVGAPSGCPWTASSDQAFATVAGGASGTGSGFVYVTVPANNTGQMLSASLTIANQPVILTQTPSSCTYSLSPSSPYSVGSAGGQVQVNITTGATCPWTVANNYPFVLAVSASSGTGSGSTNLTVGPTTTGKSRSLFLTIGASSFTITQTGDPVLTVASSHTGNFIQGQSGATYSVTVSNASSAGATTSAVTVTETLPSGLSLVSMSGGGWSCTAGSNTCTRNDSLGAGTSYSAITVAVNVGTSAASPEVNVVTVSGGGGPPSAGSDVTTILGGSAGAPISTLNYARFHAASDPDVSYACQNTNGMACNGSALAPGTNWTVNYFSHATGNFGLLRGQSTVFLTGDDSLGGLQGIGSFPSLESTGARSSFRDGLTIAGGSGTGTLNLIFTVVGFGSATAGQLGASEFQYVPVVAGQPDRSLQASYGVVNGSATIPDSRSISTLWLKSTRGWQARQPRPIIPIRLA
jgi:uncharacterized repeat protein (TIGR01451 family)